MSDDGDRALTGTSRRIRGAIAGDTDDLAWICEHFWPLLVQQARYRLRGRLQRSCEPEDVVAHAWQVALPRLRDLVARDGRYSPVLLRFLSTTILLRVNELLRQEVRRGFVGPAAGDFATGSHGPAAEVPDLRPGAATACVHAERRELVRQALAALDDADREVIVLRLVEQRPAAAVGVQLGIDANAVNVRLHRALRRLRTRLPQSVFDDLAVETPGEPT
jgi:RNA polymerase sigma factor (sigma-70 family)